MLYNVITMFVQENTKKVGNKTYRSTLLVESYRDKGKVKKRTVLNLSGWRPEQVEALKTALKGEMDKVPLCEVEVKDAKSFGALMALKAISDDLGISSSLGETKAGRLCLLMVLSRVIRPLSKRSLARWAPGQAAAEVLSLGGFDEDDLYEAMDWVLPQKERIEDELFSARHTEGCTLFLYDVTSTYLEGEKNELAAYGYNRDKKRGKKQIVIGLLTDREGFPVSVETFRGNTGDTATLPSQIEKLAKRFNAPRIVLVGDRGMVKSVSQKVIREKGWAYITAITKTQIESLVKEGAFQMSLFDEELCEVLRGDERYILRRNPERAREVKGNRQERMDKTIAEIEETARRLAASERMDPKKNYHKSVALVSKRNLEKYIELSLEGRRLSLRVNEKALEKAEAYDGCYCLKTNLSTDEMGAEDVHERYKDLGKVESAFKTMKTGLLDIRPVNHRKADRTREHVFLTMLSEMVVHELERRTCDLAFTREQVIYTLERIQAVTLSVMGKSIRRISAPDEDGCIILESLGLTCPKVLKAPL